MKISTTFKTQINFIWIFSWVRIFQALTTSIFQQNLYLHCNAGIKTEETVELKKENVDLQQKFIHGGNKTKKMKKVIEYLFGTVLPCFVKNWQKKICYPCDSIFKKGVEEKTSFLKESQ